VSCVGDEVAVVAVFGLIGSREVVVGTGMGTLLILGSIAVFWEILPAPPPPALSVEDDDGFAIPTIMTATKESSIIAAKAANLFVFREESQSQFGQFAQTPFLECVGVKG